MCALVLFHVVFAREGFVACGAENVFLPGVFLAMAGGVAGGGEGVGAGVAGCMRAGIFLFGCGGFPG